MSSLLCSIEESQSLSPSTLPRSLCTHTCFPPYLPQRLAPLFTCCPAGNQVVFFVPHVIQSSVCKKWTTHTPTGMQMGCTSDYSRRHCPILVTRGTLGPTRVHCVFPIPYTDPTDYPSMDSHCLGEISWSWPRKSCQIESQLTFTVLFPLSLLMGIISVLQPETDFLHAAFSSPPLFFEVLSWNVISSGQPLLNPHSSLIIMFNNKEG